MHKSRLGVLVIDCQGNDVDNATTFWSRALGMPAAASRDAADDTYVKLETAPDEIGLLLQKVEHPSRVHLDIETDDIEAEVRRLEALGARRVAWIKRWWVMEAPSGHRFCVVPPQRPDFDEKAKVWP